MTNAGVLGEDDRVELIEGEIVDMAAKGTAHVVCVRRLVQWFGDHRDNRYLLQVQDPIVLSDDTEPEPDLALVRLAPDEYQSDHPGPKDVFLVVEVADSSLAFDRGRKAALYARAGITDYWVVNAPDSYIDVFRDPSPGGYQDVRTCFPGESISPLAFPDLNVPVSAIVG